MADLGDQLDRNVLCCTGDAGKLLLFVRLFGVNVCMVENVLRCLLVTNLVQCMTVQ